MMQIIDSTQAFAVLAARAQEIIARKGRTLVAIDGMSASGKTTLASELVREIPGSHVVHMDDFFLPAEKRTGEFYARTLAWADVERAAQEVILPLSRGESAVYRPFVFHPVARFLDAITIPKDFSVVFVEGAYCLHPLLSPCYDLRVVKTISPEEQRSRILARNGEQMLSRYLSEWIPMENRHLEAHRVLESCDIQII